MRQAVILLDVLDEFNIRFRNVSWSDFALHTMPQIVMLELRQQRAEKPSEYVQFLFFVDLGRVHVCASSGTLAG